MAPGSHSVWSYFSAEPEPGGRAKCDICSTSLPLVDGAVTGLRLHLQFAHKILVEEDAGKETEAVIDKETEKQEAEDDDYNDDEDYEEESLTNGKAVTNDTDFECFKCFKEFQDATNYKNHVLSHYYHCFYDDLPSKKPFRCPLCDYDSRDRITLIRHYAWTHKMFHEMTDVRPDQLPLQLGTRPGEGRKRERRRSGEEEGRERKIRKKSEDEESQSKEECVFDGNKYYIKEKRGRKKKNISDEKEEPKNVGKKSFAVYKEEEIKLEPKAQPEPVLPQECKIFHGKPADLIFKYLSDSLYSNGGSDKTSDVSILCRDGVVTSHKLVLASISRMLYQDFKDNIWDETVFITMPDFSVAEVSKYLKDYYSSNDLSQHSDLNKCFGFQGSAKKPNFDKSANQSTQTDLIEIQLQKKREECLEDLMYGDDDFFNEDIDGTEEDGVVYTGGDDQPIVISFSMKKKEDGEKNLSRGLLGSGRGRTNVSFVWDHFVRINNEDRSCNYCGDILTCEKGSTWKLRTHVLKNHKDQLSEEYREYLKDVHGIDVDNFENNVFSNLPDEVVVDPETGELLSKRKMMKRLKKKERKKKKHEEEVWDHFKVDPDNPEQVLCQLCLYCMRNHDDATPEMLEHLRQQHQLFLADDENNLLCSHCGLTFEDKASRNKHEGQHRNCQFWCQVADCGKGFQTQEKLDIHSRKHTGEKIFNCDVCGKAVATIGALKTHMRKHDQNILRNHQCFECGKAFANKGSLKMHLKVHTDELPHQCSVCLKRFKFPISKHQHKCEGSPRVHAATRNLYYMNNLDVDHAY